MANEVEVEALTLGDLVSVGHIHGNVEIRNECNETLLRLAEIGDNVCPLNKTLSTDLLKRSVLNTGAGNQCLIIKVEGVEDAE